MDIMKLIKLMNTSIKNFLSLSLLVLLVLLLPTALYASEFSFFSLINKDLNIPEHVLAFAVVILIMLLFGLIYKKELSAKRGSVIPGRKVGIGNIIELVAEVIYNQCKSIIGEKEGPKHFSFIASLFFMILFSNLIGLIPGFIPPSSNMNTTFALGVVAFVYYTVYGCKKQGIINYFKHFMGPLWYAAILLFPIELVSDFVRPLTLAVRLRGNMFGDHLVLGVFTFLVPYVVPMIFLAFGLLVSVVQSFVFCILTMVYISMAKGHDHEDEHAHEENEYRKKV
ncbi:MAG: F0F1 ATP synthase subunit A [Oligoflexia bacterium]|nr:F0F1 ATP synthase subunit A [Oligoflexia bacterium]